MKLLGQARSYCGGGEEERRKGGEDGKTIKLIKRFNMYVLLVSVREYFSGSVTCYLRVYTVRKKR